MKIQWRSLFFKILVWFALEIILTFLGFDDLADYSDFILETKKIYAEQAYNLSSHLKPNLAFCQSGLCFLQLEHRQIILIAPLDK